jgi:hypothetical protein
MGITVHRKIDNIALICVIIHIKPPCHRARHKKRLKKIVSTVSDISVGRSDYSLADLVEDVKTGVHLQEFARNRAQ